MAEFAKSQVATQEPPAAPVVIETRGLTREFRSDGVTVEWIGHRQAQGR